MFTKYRETKYQIITLKTFDEDEFHGSDRIRVSRDKAVT